MHVFLTIVRVTAGRLILIGLWLPFKYMNARFSVFAITQTNDLFYF